LCLTVSVALNLLIFLVLAKILFWGSGLGEDSSLSEHHYSGKKLGGEKVAIVRIDGILMEGMTGYFRKQIDGAAADDAVKAVVVRIESPGGTITASDDIYRRLCELRDGNTVKKTRSKPLVVSMGSVAASGGYYIAMPSDHLVAERSTITGSIGVYAAFPNVAELASKYGVKMNVIKAGRVKDSGSMFREMSPQERQLWQDMVDYAYGQFCRVVTEGRGHRLKYSLIADIPEDADAQPKSGMAASLSSIGPERLPRFPRQLADGGIFTADKALKYGLVDQVGYLDDAVAVARSIAGVGDDCKVVTYDRQQPLWSLLLEQMGMRSEFSFHQAGLVQSLQPRLWYMMPESDIAGLLSAGRNDW
jgi:protease-4